MASYDDTIYLADFEYEDVFDVVRKLEKSFGLTFKRDTFYDVKTFGDLCDIFENNITYQHTDDCTKQQAFYQVRNAISMTQKISEDQVNPDSKLTDLFPHKNRRKKAKEFKNYLGHRHKDIDLSRLASLSIYHWIPSKSCCIFLRLEDCPDWYSIFYFGLKNSRSF